MRSQGFTLLELTIAMGMLVVVAMLGFTALQSSTRSASLANAEETVQRNVRDVLAVMTRELEMAASVDDEPLVQALATPTASHEEVVFQIPLDATGTNWSTPITYRFLNEDANANGLLDDGEDGDGDGVLTRRIVRIQNDFQRTVAAANDLSSARFDLDASGKTLTVTLTSTKVFGAGKQQRLAQAAMSSRILLLN